MLTDPRAPAKDGVVAGRKNLFAAINLPDPAGNATIVSQPCAAAFHPNGYVAYVLACASEDLLTFDLTQRSRPTCSARSRVTIRWGLALDTAGARAFVLADGSADPSPDAPLRSKSLHVIDLAGEACSSHATVVGAPIALVAKDPLDPDLRAGLRFFFRAASAKGTLATTGNAWMSCGGCHLDGFSGATAGLFEDLAPADAALDARIGHTGLHGSTSPPSPRPKAPPALRSTPTTC